MELDALFDAWLFTAEKPAVGVALATTMDARNQPATSAGADAEVRSWLERSERHHERGRY